MRTGQGVIKCRTIQCSQLTEPELAMLSSVGCEYLKTYPDYPIDPIAMGKLPKSYPRGSAPQQEPTQPLLADSS
jgi:hypothetical protein